MNPAERIAQLEAENAELRRELDRQWAANHAEHCGVEGKHNDCHWPKPSILEESPGARESA